jgi:hypothetical protein
VALELSGILAGVASGLSAYRTQADVKNAAVGIPQFAIYELPVGMGGNEPPVLRIKHLV